MADISKQLDEMNKGINDKLDFIMEGTASFKNLDADF